MSYGVGGRRGSDPVLLWLWHRQAATDPIRPLAWEPPYAAGASLKRSKDKKFKKKVLGEANLQRQRDSVKVVAWGWGGDWGVITKGRKRSFGGE